MHVPTAPSAYDHPRVTPGSLADARVIVVGGSSGFGRQVVVDAASAGAHLIVVGRDHAKAHAVAHEAGGVGGAALAFALDATSEEGLRSLLEIAGPIDHVVSTLGGEQASGVSDASEEEVARAQRDRAASNGRLLRALEPRVRDGGSFTFTSAAGDAPHEAMVRELAIELAPRVRVNAVAPTWSPTPLWREHDDAEVRETQRRMVETIPLGRVGEVGEVAQGYLFLMTCGFVTGQTLAIDGGMSLL